MPAASTRIRRIALRTALLVVVATLGLVVTGALPTLLGYDSFVVTGSSMEPTVRKGSVVIARRVAPHTIAAGDIITFRRTQDPGVAVTHRVIDVREVDGVPVFETKGDANETADPEAVQATALISKMQYSVPYVGYVLMFGRSTMGKAVLIVVPLLALALSFLPARRLRRRDGGVEATAASPEPSEAPARVAPEEPPPARRFPPGPAAAPDPMAGPAVMVAPAVMAAQPPTAVPARPAAPARAAAPAVMAAPPPIVTLPPTAAPVRAAASLPMVAPPPRAAPARAAASLPMVALPPMAAPAVKAAPPPIVTPPPTAAPARAAASLPVVAPPPTAAPARAGILLPVARPTPTVLRAPAAVPVSAPPSMALASDRGAATSQRQPDRSHNAAAAARARILARLTAQVAHRGATA